ncbi:hypothetical protein Q5H93_13765 [Hymenobacter sp. ASUV-10]|uniref:3-oxoacyl-ACP synthase n=1 Tax=Hymenobacter aranciens TaxID=3063996 RepID=A0ABT9BC10_9BACT|nr:hypothetical protein [Hymenobacter sp. ASUV-10]MDO7875805.1 hypothetical protein [Hymenobacter sp. ASUV-10]
MKTSFKILGSCRIDENKIFVNQQLVFDNFAINFSQFADTAYQNQGVDYPRFYKMNNLSKLGFLAAEYLLSNFVESPSAHVSGELTGIILANHYSSLDTDLKHQQFIKQGVASPAVFVYTLPNILIGELCIRQGIKGENTFFIAADYDIPGQTAYVTQLLNDQLITHCFVGWVEYTAAGHQAFLAFVGPSAEAALPDYTSTTINLLFHQSYGRAES